MSAPISDDGKIPNYSKFAPKRLREQLPMPAARHLYLGANGSFVQRRRSGRQMSEFAPWPEQVREPPPRRLSGLSADRPDCSGEHICGSRRIVDRSSRNRYGKVQAPRSMQVRRHRKPPNHLTALRRITRRQIPHSFQPQGLQRPLARRRLQARSKRHLRRRSKRRSHRTRKNHGTPFAG